MAQVEEAEQKESAEDGASVIRVAGKKSSVKDGAEAATPKLEEQPSADLEVQEKISLLEWFANEYRRFGCSLEFVTNKSQEGSQFCRGFGGIGGILRYQLDIRAFDDLSDGEYYEDSE